MIMRHIAGRILGNIAKRIYPRQFYLYPNLCRCPCMSSKYSTNSQELSVHNPLIKKYLETLVNEYKNLGSSTNDTYNKNAQRLLELQPIFKLYSQKMNLHHSLHSLQELSSAERTDKELHTLIEEEKQEYIRQIKDCENELMHVLLAQEAQETYRGVVMEITAGVGGQEAMLFAGELFDMYSAYINFKGWKMDDANSEQSDIGGLRHAMLFISDYEAYNLLKHEAGVHRVQRIPATEKAGRVHTSTVSVTVLPQPDEVDIELCSKDLQVETKRASGAGGQHVNKTESAVRIVHIPTGISVECQVDRSQIRNKKEAMQKLKALLVKKHFDEQTSVANTTRKLQVKSNLRSEKIRTYNYNQDRITDHRISITMHNLPEFLKGCEVLDELIQKLVIYSKTEALLLKISNVDR